MFYNLTKELEKRGILRSDPRLTPVTTILKNIFLERLDRSGEMTQGIVGGSRELDICKKLLPLQHVCAGWRGSRDAQRVTLTQRASRISSWTSPSSKSIFWNFETINYTFFIKSQLIEKLTVNRVIKPSIVLIDKAFKGRLVVPDFHSFKSDISDIFSRSATWQTQIRNRLPKVRVWKRRNCVETRPTPKPGKLGGCDLHNWRTKVFQFVCLSKISVPFVLWEICCIFA